jgi:hypothetical protein
VAVYSHPKDPEALTGGFLEGTAIADLIETRWGDISLVRATRALLLEALEDRSLTHFAILSESCVPVRPLGEILRRLEIEPRPQFTVRDLKGAAPQHVERARKIAAIPAACWRFQPQWMLLDRVAAVWAAVPDFTDAFAGMFAADEAYFATVLCLQGYPLEDLVLGKDSTWTHWEGGGSPRSHMVLEPRHVRAILHSGALFARKFPPGADVGNWGLHRPAVVGGQFTCPAS